MRLLSKHPLSLCSPSTRQSAGSAPTCVCGLTHQWPRTGRTAKKLLLGTHQAMRSGKSPTAQGLALRLPLGTQPGSCQPRTDRQTSVHIQLCLDCSSERRIPELPSQGGKVAGQRLNPSPHTRGPSALPGWGGPHTVQPSTDGVPASCPMPVVLLPLTWGHGPRGEKKDCRPQREETHPSSSNQTVTPGLHNRVVQPEHFRTLTWYPIFTKPFVFSVFPQII